jgi:hypothetical protein
LPRLQGSQGRHNAGCQISLNWNGALRGKSA